MTYHTIIYHTSGDPGPSWHGNANSFPQGLRGGRGSKRAGAQSVRRRGVARRAAHRVPGFLDSQNLSALPDKVFDMRIIKGSPQLACKHTPQRAQLCGSPSLGGYSCTKARMDRKAVYLHWCATIHMAGGHLHDATERCQLQLMRISCTSVVVLSWAAFRPSSPSSPLLPASPRRPRSRSRAPASAPAAGESLRIWLVSLLGPRSRSYLPGVSMLRVKGPSRKLAPGRSWQTCL